MRAFQEEGEVVAATGDGPFLLNGKWVLWFDGALSSGRRSQANDWAKNMKRIGDFASVEEFWVPPCPAATAPPARRAAERNHQPLGAPPPQRA